ncbi:MAG: hypothetical protein AAGA58_03765 [Verrucomicrobiota bacterium]
MSAPNSTPSLSPIGIIGSLWAIAGLFVLFGNAIWRLSLRAVEAISSGLGAVEWSVLAVWVGFMAYSEGYKGFQKSFSPRTAARIHHLATSPNLLRTLLAPIFAMGFFHADRRTRIVAYVLTFGIVVLILLIRYLPQPWRGIIDAGVVVGLSWGIVSLAIFIFRALVRGKPDASPCVPREES